MRDFFSRRYVKSFIITLAVIISVCIVSNIDNSVVSSVLNSLTSSMQALSANAADELVADSYEVLKTKTEMQQRELASLRAQLVDYVDVKQENAKLMKYYELKKNNPTYEYMPASVIRRDPNDEFYSFTIDRGLTSGVAVNNPVVTENGLVGWVTQADATTAKISTILNVDSKVGAIDKISQDSGVITGRVDLADSNLTAFTKISASNKITPGDILVTTGITGLYPPNLIVGEVKELKYDEYDTSLYAVIEPYENIRAVQDVVVITGFTGEGVVMDKQAAADTRQEIAPTTVAATTVAQTTTSEEE
ncbi:MAG: rod shape-determining protein MreC [Oscillospiraceae bacterium]|nr:rod shape-determining protein MreC [Oscillospiraceae bacterium]